MRCKELDVMISCVLRLLCPSGVNFGLHYFFLRLHCQKNKRNIKEISALRKKASLGVRSLYLYVCGFRRWQKNFPCFCTLTSLQQLWNLHLRKFLKNLVKLQRGHAEKPFANLWALFYDDHSVVLQDFDLNRFLMLKSLML